MLRLEFCDALLQPVDRLLILGLVFHEDVIATRDDKTMPPTLGYIITYDHLHTGCHLVHPP